VSIEVEKKYRLTRERRESLLRRLAELRLAPEAPEEFEENTLYAGSALDARAGVLRLRRTNVRALLTYKERVESDSAIKRRREEETQVGDPEALAAILERLGLSPSLVYEKRRTTWHVAGVELVVDELPFGFFAEIEGEEKAIEEAERLLHLTEAEAVHDTYPALTMRHGTRRGDVMEARFEAKDWKG
jgi:adenylate cyclase class 2